MVGQSMQSLALQIVRDHFGVAPMVVARALSEVKGAWGASIEDLIDLVMVASEKTKREK